MFPHPQVAKKSILGPTVLALAPKKKGGCIKLYKRTSGTGDERSTKSEPHGEIQVSD